MKQVSEISIYLHLKDYFRNMQEYFGNTKIPLYDYLYLAILGKG